MADAPALTAEQFAAANAPDGPLLIVAGPGSGKTAVLVVRIAYLIRERGVGPASILALTFAAKAARELRERLDRALGAAGAGVDLATFHAFGLRIVRQWPAELGYRPGPVVVYGEVRARELLREVAAGLGVNLARVSLAAMARAVEWCRLAGGTASTSPLAALAWRLPVFSPCGTRLPEERLGFLARADAVYGVFDGDDEGRAAAARFGGVLGERWRPLRLPDGMDLNDLARREGGRAEFFRLLATARNAAIAGTGDGKVEGDGGRDDERVSAAAGNDRGRRDT